METQLKILEFALLSPHPIVDPFCKSRPERMLAHEKSKRPNIAINFLVTCRAYHYEGTRMLWANNTFVFTSPASLKQFAELDLSYRRKIKHVTFRIIARFYDDVNRTHRLPRSYHSRLKNSVRLAIHRRPNERTLARRGFRAYAYSQLVDFLEALLPPHDPQLAAHFTSANTSHTTPYPRLLPSLESLRIDFVNFSDDLLSYPPPQLHDLASHQLGCMLNELTLTGVPTDECGLRVNTELSGLLKHEGLLIDHGPIMVAMRSGVRLLNNEGDQDFYSARVVRAMYTPHNNHFPHQRHDLIDLPPAPPEEGDPPFSAFHSCRTIWKKVPVKLEKSDERRWELFDRVSGLSWHDVEIDGTMLDEDAGPTECGNCGETHLGAIPPDELMDLYDDNF